MGPPITIECSPTFDKMAPKVRAEVKASICRAIHDRMSPLQREELRRLEEEPDQYRSGWAASATEW